MVGEVEKLLAGRFSLDRFVVSKTLRAEYKAPDTIAHKVLADRANERGTDNFTSNDRIPFVFTVTPEVKGQKLLQGDKMDTPSYVVEKGLKVDYRFYLTNQIEVSRQHASAM